MELGVPLQKAIPVYDPGHEVSTVLEYFLPGTLVLVRTRILAP